MIVKTIKMSLVTVNWLEQECDDCRKLIVKGGKAWRVVKQRSPLAVEFYLHPNCARELGKDMAEGVARK